MKVYLNAGFSDPLAHELPLIASLQFAGVRRDVTVERIAEFAKEFVPYPSLYMLCLLRTKLDVSIERLVGEAAVVAKVLRDQKLVGRCGVEVGNEPNLIKGWDAERFRRAVNECAAAIWDVEPKIDVVSGGISNTGSEQQAYLRAVVEGLNPKVIVGYHTYRTESSPYMPLRNFTTRAAEDAALLKIIGTRRHVNTEFGWHTAVSRVQVGWTTRTVRFSEQQTADFIRQELKLLEKAGCESAALYQLNDDAKDAGFGIRAQDGRLKPSARVAAEFAGPSVVPVASFRVLEGTSPLKDVKVTFRLDDPSQPPVVAFTDGAGRVEYQITRPLNGVTVRLEKEGYETREERRLIPASTASEAQEWPASAQMQKYVPRPSFQVRQGSIGVPDVQATFRLDDPKAPLYGTSSDQNGYVVYPAHQPGVGVTVLLEKAGYVSYEERRLIPTVTTNDAPEWAPEVQLKLVRKAYTRAQLALIQCDIMLWCPQLKPTFVDGWDAKHGIRQFATDGLGEARGITAGWIWTIQIWSYDAAERQVAYRTAKSRGWTHWPLQVAHMGPGAGYHGIFPMTQAMSDVYGPLLNTIHNELLAADLIPVCAGCAPGRPPHPGFDPGQVLVCMSDWDDTNDAASRIQALTQYFPQALSFFEVPATHDNGEPIIWPSPSAGDPVPPGPNTSNAWIRAMRQANPNWVGVIHELPIGASVEEAGRLYALKHGWWHDVAECQGESKTFELFWKNLSEEENRRFSDATAALCPWFKGTMSGWTMRPAPADEAHESHEEVGDMIDPRSITMVDVPEVMTWERDAQITRLTLSDEIEVDFTKRFGPGSWPDMPFGVDGKDDLQFSMGMAFNRGGRWYAAAPIQCWRQIKGAGGPIMKQQGVPFPGAQRFGGQIAANWFYDPKYGPLHEYQPRPGELVGFFVCSGDIRGRGFSSVKRRSNIVTFTLPNEGESVTHTW